LTFKHYIHKFSLMYLYIYRTRKLVAEHWCATYRVTNKTFILKGAGIVQRARLVQA
jgi:hypothetical protein